MNSTSAEKRFDGIIPCVENWHTKPVLLEVNCASTCGLCIIFVKCFCNFLNACTKLLASIEILIVLTVVFYHKSYGSTYSERSAAEHGTMYCYSMVLCACISENE